MNTQLAKLDQATRLLAEAKTIQEVKNVIDLAEMAKLYAKKMNLGKEAEQYAYEIKLEAERKMGQTLMKMEKNKGAATQRGTLVEPRLEELGVTKKQSFNTQNLAKLPDESFEKVKSGKMTAKKAKSEFKKNERLDHERKLAETVKLPKDVQIINDDFRNVEIKDIDLILTDPPFPQEFIPLWKDLGDFAMKSLKPSGFLVAYSGQLHLPEVIKLLSESGLQYYWTWCLYHKGGTQIVHPRGLMCRWKPVLVFQKPPFKKIRTIFEDCVLSDKREKDGHEWQQGEGGAAKLIDTFSLPGDLVVDTFCGAGTFPKVAHKLKRKTVGIEIDKDHFLTSKSKFND